jgi:hypothetical protein
MTSLDVRAIAALRRVRGMSASATRIADGLVHRVRQKQPITVRERHALYSICWRFRRQIPMPLQVKLTIALAEAKAAVELFLIENPPAEKIRAFRSADTKAGLAKAKPNPLDDLFPEPVSQ